MLSTNIMDEENLEICPSRIWLAHDNTSMINISKNLAMHSKTKHIPIEHHFVKEQVFENAVQLEYIDTIEQVAYIFTNMLPKETFEYLRGKLGIIYALQIEKK